MHMRTIHSLRDSRAVLSEGRYSKDTSMLAVERILNAKKRRTERLRQKAIDSFHQAQRELEILERAELELALRLERDKNRNDRRQRAIVKYNNAARTIQSGARQFLDVLDKRKIIIQHNKEVAAAHVIQREWLHYRLRTQLEKQYQEIYEDSVKSVQLWIRARNRKKKRLASQRIISSQTRAWLSRKKARMERMKVIQQREHVACTMQAMWRGFKARHLGLSGVERRRRIRKLEREQAERDRRLVIRSSENRRRKGWIPRENRVAWIDKQSNQMEGVRAMSAYGRNPGRFVIYTGEESGVNGNGRRYHYSRQGITSTAQRLKVKRMKRHQRVVQQKLMVNAARNTMASMFERRGLGLDCKESIFPNDPEKQKLIEEDLAPEIETLLEEIEREHKARYETKEKKKKVVISNANLGGFFLTQAEEESIRSQPVDGVWTEYWKKNESKMERRLSRSRSLSKSKLKRRNANNQTIGKSYFRQRSSTKRGGMEKKQRKVAVAVASIERKKEKKKVIVKKKTVVSSNSFQRNRTPDGSENNVKKKNKTKTSQKKNIKIHSKKRVPQQERATMKVYDMLAVSTVVDKEEWERRKKADAKARRSRYENMLIHR
eukprot:g527.t1